MYLQRSKNITEARSERKLVLFVKVANAIGEKKTDELTHTSAFFHTAKSVHLTISLSDKR